MTTTRSADRAPQPCHHKVADHEHGTRACYVHDRCRCLPCTVAISDYERHRSRQRAYGRAAYVDAEPVREHVRALMAAGIGWKRVARLAGVQPSTLCTVLYRKPGRPPQARMRHAGAARLLAVRADFRHVAPGSRVDATGTHRRVRALAAAGWSQARIAAQLDMLHGNFTRTMHSQEVNASTARRVAELYDQLWNTAPPEHTHRERIAASRARNYARAAGWPPPAAWDDDTIDEPSAQPMLDGPATDELDEIAVLRILSGTLHLPLYDRSPERVEAIRRMAGRGLSDQQIADRIGGTRDAVTKVRERRHIPSAVLNRGSSSSTAGYGPVLSSTAAR